MILAIRGNADYYTLQWAERGPDSARALALDPAYWRAHFAKLTPVGLCPIVPFELPPYPSCLKSGAAPQPVISPGG